MKKNSITERAIRSASYKKAKEKAAEYIDSPQKLDELLQEAGDKARSSKGWLGEIWEKLTACLRLLKAYAKGEYRDIPLKSILIIVAAIVYFVMPLDLLPDFIFGLGLLDDAGVIAWTLAIVSSEIDKFIEWEKARDNQANDG